MKFHTKCFMNTGKLYRLYSGRFTVIFILVKYIAIMDICDLSFLLTCAFVISLFQSGEKTALVTAILVSQTLYFTLVIEIIPATSKRLPLLGR